MLFGKERDAIAIERIKTFEPPEGYYVAFSGGKDSIVVLDLVKRAGVKYDAHYHVTGIDPPELVHFIKRQHPEVERGRPDITMFAGIVKEQCPPLRQQRWCCVQLKEGGGAGRMVITGIRRAESGQRSKRRMNERCMKDGTKTFLHPIIDWQDADVWEYIDRYKIPYCRLYDEGFERLGCIMCPMKPERERRKDAARWPGYHRLYLRAFERMLKARADAGKVTTWQNAEEVMEWWLSGTSPRKETDGQVMMFTDN